MVNETGLPNSRSVVQFSDGALGVVGRARPWLPNDGIGEPVNTYVLAPTESHIRQKEILLTDGKNETAVAVARDPDSGHTLFAIEGDFTSTFQPCFSAAGLPKIGDVVRIYHGGVWVDTAPIKSQVTGFSPDDGGIIIDVAFSEKWRGYPVFNGQGELLGFMTRGTQWREPYAGIKPAGSPYAVVVPVKPRFVQESIQKLENHLGANKVSLHELKADPGKYSAMRNTTAYRPRDLGFRALFSQANSGYVVAGFNDTIDINGDWTVDIFRPGNRSIPTYADSDPSFKPDFMNARVMAITEINWTNYSGDPQVSHFGNPGFENAWKELELYGDLEQPVEITATCYFDDNTQPVEKKYTLTAQAVIEDVNGKKRTRRNHEKSDLVRSTDVRRSVINRITVPNYLGITDTSLFFGEAMKLTNLPYQNGSTGWPFEL